MITYMEENISPNQFNDFFQNLALFYGKFPQFGHKCLCCEVVKITFNMHSKHTVHVQGRICIYLKVDILGDLVVDAHDHLALVLGVILHSHVGDPQIPFALALVTHNLISFILG